MLMNKCNGIVVVVCGRVSMSHHVSFFPVFASFPSSLAPCRSSEASLCISRSILRERNPKTSTEKNQPLPQHRTEGREQGVHKSAMMRQSRCALTGKLQG